MDTTEEFRDIPRIAMQVSRNIVVASIQVDLDEEVLARFRDDLLEAIHASGAQGAVLDLSGLETLDSTEFAGLRKIISMGEIMGAQSVVAGMRPGVVSALIESGVDVAGLRAAINLDEAYALLQAELAPETQDEEPPQSDAQGEADPLSAEASPSTRPAMPVDG